jgi:MerR family transcriptional regulator, light-induced transcriptional regulator
MGTFMAPTDDDRADGSAGGAAGPLPQAAAPEGATRPPARPGSVEGLARLALERLAQRPGRNDLSPAFLDSFCTLLLEGNYRATERILETMTQGRAGYAGVADGILAAAARHLGEKWLADGASFAEVSVAVAQIFRLNQAFGQRYTPWTRVAGQRLAIFGTLPAQSHNLGIVLAAEAFRQEGWQVKLLLDTPGQDIVERVRRMRPEVVGFSVSVNDRRHQVEYVIGELRALPLRFRVLVGGSAAQDFAKSVPRGWRVEVVTDIATALRGL